MSNQQNLCQPPEYPYELLREDIGDFLEQTKRRREIEEIVGDMPIDRLRELVEADREGRCVVFVSGYPVVSIYGKAEDGLCIREVSGVITEEEYKAALRREQDGNRI